MALYLLATLNLPANTLVTFRVDMTAQAQIGRWSHHPEYQWNVAVSGSFNNWALFTLGNTNPENPCLFYGTFLDTNDPPGGTLTYRFYCEPFLWEYLAATGSSNRTASLPPAEDASLLLPVAYFDDLPPGAPVVTNEVTFQVDMSAQRPGLWPDPGLNLIVTHPGTFNGWNHHSFALTNNPAASNTNLYSGAASIVGQPGAQHEYRFCYYQQGLLGGIAGFAGNFTLEHPLGTGGASRSFNLLTTNGPLVLPAVLFGDLKPSGMLPASTLVCFNVDMTGAVATDGHAFNSAVDKVYVNGDFVRWLRCGWSGGYNVGWSPWDSCALGSHGNQLTNVPSTRVYSAAFTLRQPNAVALTYRYTINGPDNEPTGGTNHVRYVREVGEYTLPLDTFGTPFREPSFGDLRTTRSDSKHIRVSWLGRPGVQVQSSATPASAPWVDHPETDGLSSTNWPADAGQRFFRLVKP